MEKANRHATTTELDLRRELDLQQRHKEEELAALSLQHSKRLEELIEQHNAELRKLEALKDEEIKVVHYKKKGQKTLKGFFYQTFVSGPASNSNFRNYSGIIKDLQRYASNVTFNYQ